MDCDFLWNTHKSNILFNLIKFTFSREKGFESDKCLIYKEIAHCLFPGDRKTSSETKTRKMSSLDGDNGKCVKSTLKMVDGDWICSNAE